MIVGKVAVVENPTLWIFILALVELLQKSANVPVIMKSYTPVSDIELAEIVILPDELFIESQFAICVERLDPLLIVSE